MVGLKFFVLVRNYKLIDPFTFRNGFWASEFAFFLLSETLGAFMYTDVIKATRKYCLFYIHCQSARDFLFVIFIWKYSVIFDILVDAIHLSSNTVVRISSLCLTETLYHLPWLLFIPLMFHFLYFILKCDENTKEELRWCKAKTEHMINRFND